MEMAVSFNDVKKWINKHLYWVPDWVKTGLLCLAEIVVVFLFSNAVFIVEALKDKDTEKSIVVAFWDAISTSAQSGEVLTLVCALIAPVVYALLIEPKKRIVWGGIFIVLMAIYGLAIVQQYSGQEISRVSTVDVYIAAAILWITSIFVSNFPPENKGYSQVMEEDSDAFTNLTKGYR